MTYKSLEHSIRSIMESTRRDVKVVAKPEDSRKEIENTPRAETARESAPYTRMQEIQKKIIDEEYLPQLTLEEVEELHRLITNLLDEKKKTKKDKIQGEEPDVPGGFTVGTKMATGVNSSPSLATEETKDAREYGYEGEMAMSQIKSIMNHGEQLMKLLKPNTDMPEWVQSKITLASDYIQTAADYFATEIKEEVEQVDEISKEKAGAAFEKSVQKYGAFADKKPFEKRKLTIKKIEGRAKVPVTEEVEQVDELDRNQGSILNRYISKTNPDFKSPKEIEKRKEGRALALKKKWGDKNYGTDEPKVKAVQRENVEFSEAELEHFNAVLEGRRGRPPKNQEEPLESKGSIVAQLRDSKPKTNPQTGRDEHEVNLGNKKVKVSTKHAQSFLSAHGAAKTAADKDKVEKDFRAKISEDLEQIDEFQGTIKKAATSSQMMSKATQAQGKLQQKQTTSLVKQKLDAQKRELIRRQQTAQTAAQRSAIKT